MIFKYVCRFPQMNCLLQVFHSISVSVSSLTIFMQKILCACSLCRTHFTTKFTPLGNVSTPPSKIYRYYSVFMFLFFLFKHRIRCWTAVCSFLQTYNLPFKPKCYWSADKRDLHSVFSGVYFIFTELQIFTNVIFWKSVYSPWSRAMHNHVVKCPCDCRLIIINTGQHETPSAA